MSLLQSGTSRQGSRRRVSWLEENNTTLDAYVLVAKYVDHLALYRQEAIFERARLGSILPHGDGTTHFLT